MRFLRREAGGLSGALLAHAALCLWLMRPAAASYANVEGATPPVEVELETPPPSPEQPPSPSPATEPSPATVVPPVLARASSVEPASGPAAAHTEAAPSPAASSDQPFTFSPTVTPSLANESLGVGGRNPFIGAVPDVGGAPGPSAPVPEANVAPGIQKSLHDALAARDHELGLDSGGPLIAIAEEATRTSDAPDNSRAVFEVSIDANGEVTGIRVVEASQARQAWDTVATHMRTTTRTRRIPPRGQASKGIVVTLEVKSRLTLPSGASGGVDPKLNDDGTAGVHVGFDLSDVGQHAKRDVHARILGERAL
jgi:hypothetical protein